MSSPGGPAPKSSFVDQNFRSYDGAGCTGATFSEIEVLDPADGYPDPVVVNDTLKISNTAFVRVANKTILNYNEDCIDLCRVSFSSLSNCDLHPLGRNGVTIKGASNNINLVGLRFWSHGSESDIELGQFDNYWSPGRIATESVFLVGCSAVDGKPLVIRVWDARPPTIQHFIDREEVVPHKIQVIPKWIWFPYFLFRYAQLRVTNFIRRLRGQPQIKTA